MVFDIRKQHTNQLPPRSTTQKKLTQSLKKLVEHILVDGESKLSEEEVLAFISYARCDLLDTAGYFLFVYVCVCVLWWLPWCVGYVFILFSKPLSSFAKLLSPRQ